MASCRRSAGSREAGLSEEALADSDGASDLGHQVLVAEWETAVFETLNWLITHIRSVQYQGGNNLVEIVSGITTDSAATLVRDAMNAPTVP